VPSKIAKILEYLAVSAGQRPADPRGSTCAMSWQQYLLESRLLWAMAPLSEPGPSVLAVAAAVGSDTPGG
jgi:hypothetical protein